MRKTSRQREEYNRLHRQHEVLQKRLDKIRCSSVNLTGKSCELRGVQKKMNRVRSLLHLPVHDWLALNAQDKALRRRMA